MATFIRRRLRHRKVQSEVCCNFVNQIVYFWFLTQIFIAFFDK